MRTFLRFVVLAAVVCLGAALGFGQGSSAELHVTVKDAKGGALKGATVTARNEAQNFERTAAVAADGEYVFQALPPGLYNITVDAAGFAREQVNNLRLTVGQVANLPIEAKVAAVNETVNVSSQAELVETQRTGSATTIDQVQIDNLPINGRNYINFALTNSQLARDTAPSIGAAPTSGLNVSGQRARSNLVTVDGADFVDNSVNGVRSTVSQDAVQEFQLQTNGYNAEYGRASGGVINIVTKSGSNDFHGDVFGYLRNRDIQAVNPFSTIPDPAYTRVQAGFTAGGAIKKDRTFYFLSYETTRRHESGYSSIGANNFGFQNFDFTPFGIPAQLPLTPQQIAFIGQTAATGDPSLIQQAVQYGLLAGSTAATAITGKNPLYNLGLLPSPYLFTPVTTGVVNALPASYVPMNSLIGNFPIFEGTSLWSGRLDQQISANNSLSLRVGVSPSTVTGIQVNAQGPQNFGQNAWSRTSDQTYRDFNGTASDTWTLGSNKVNEFRFQYARRGLLYNYASEAPGGSNVAINIPGYAFFGREPFSYVRRTEQRYEALDNFTITKGRHTVKFGFDADFIPLRADFTVNFGGLYDFGSVGVGALTNGTPFPDLSPVQAYGVGIPQDMVQGVGYAHDAFTNLPLGLFLQDSWRVTDRFTLNYGVRYDVEFTPTFAAATPLAQSAQDAFGITQGIPRDFNNVAPRIGFAWDPRGDGKTVVRASYGMFYDHPLLALAFDSNVADATKDAQIVLFGAAPSACNPADPVGTLTATNAFQGNLGCLPPSFTYLPNQQRFDPTPGTNSIWVNQNFLTGGPGGGPFPLTMLPFGYPVAKNFVYAYSEQANLTVEHDFGHGYDLRLEYNFNGGRHLNRPINVNATRSDLLDRNLYNYITATYPGATPQQQAALAAQLGPLSVNAIGAGANGPYVPAALVSFFRPSGLNPTLSPYVPSGGLAFVNQVLSSEGLGGYGTIPFSDIPANYSNGTSDYNGFTADLEKRFSHHFQFLASYTWSHSIDDSTDLQSTLEPQNNYDPNADRSNSLFDERHRFVFSGVYETGSHHEGAFGKLISDWTFAPIIEFASGRPFNIITGTDQNFDFSAGTDRPSIAVAGQTNACGPAIASKYSPSGYLIEPCYLDIFFNGGTPPQLAGTLPRNYGVKPWNVFNDLRVARRLNFGERLHLDAIMDVFNLANKFNVADVNPIWTSAGTPTAAFDPRQFQFALKLSW